MCIRDSYKDGRWLGLSYYQLTLQPLPAVPVPPVPLSALGAAETEQMCIRDRFYNLFSGLLRAVGDSKTPLYFLCLSSALNVVLDLLFVVTFSMGVAGAAWATILSQGVSALLCLVYMLKKFPILRTGRADWAWHGPMVRRLARIGIPTALSNSVTAIGCMILQAVSYTHLAHGQYGFFTSPRPLFSACGAARRSKAPRPPGR